MGDRGRLFRLLRLFCILDIDPQSSPIEPNRARGRHVRTLFSPARPSQHTRHTATTSPSLTAVIAQTRKRAPSWPTCAAVQCSLSNSLLITYLSSHYLRPFSAPFQTIGPHLHSRVVKGAPAGDLWRILPWNPSAAAAHFRADATYCPCPCPRPFPVRMQLCLSVPNPVSTWQTLFDRRLWATRVESSFRQIWDIWAGEEERYGRGEGETRKFARVPGDIWAADACYMWQRQGPRCTQFSQAKVKRYFD